MAFSCDDPDFFIRCLPEEITFGVRKSALQESSSVFADMFSCCDLDPNAEQSMDVCESTNEFAVLLKFLHNAPLISDEGLRPNSLDFSTKLLVKMPEHAIPFPVLKLLLVLSDKYMLVPRIVEILNSHLLAYKSVYPLQVYGIATRLGNESIAQKASVYLIHPPLHKYTPEDVKAIPTAEAYHKILLLQHHRTMKLREVLMNEDLFPHRYGECSKHKHQAVVMWENRKKILVTRLESGTDVGAEMGNLKNLIPFKDCPVCKKAHTAATGMLAYKCRRVARRIDKVP